jgi:hypothetical protein
LLAFFFSRCLVSFSACGGSSGAVGRGHSMASAGKRPCRARGRGARRVRPDPRAGAATHQLLRPLALPALITRAVRVRAARVPPALFVLGLVLVLLVLLLLAVLAHRAGWVARRCARGGPDGSAAAAQAGPTRRAR